MLPIKGKKKKKKKKKKNNKQKNNTFESAFISSIVH